VGIVLSTTALVDPARESTIAAKVELTDSIMLTPITLIFLRFLPKNHMSSPETA
jgi:glucose-6-phosphate-specific signal transduction histidine kinase